MSRDALLALAGGLVVLVALAFAIRRADAGDRRPLKVVSALLLGATTWIVAVAVLAVVWSQQRGNLDGAVFIVLLALLPAVLIALVVLRRG